MWLHPEPALERMVVSEMGDVWSPNTEPASVAASVTVMTEGAPRGAGGETQEGRDNEDDGGQESGRDAAGRDRVLHEGGRGQKVAADAAEGPGQHEDDVGGHHVLHALNASVQEILHGHEAARHELQESHGKGAEGSPDQSLGG